MGLDTSRPTLQVVGNYDLIERIAEGGMGTVYKGRHRDSGEIVAVKVVPPNMAQNTILLQRFENEFNAARKLDHPNIVRAVDFGHCGNTPYLVMEFVDGESLGQRVERDGKLPVDDAIRLIAQVAQGLHRAHKQGMIHRDVKPDNILVTRDGQAKLADLGLVKETESDLNLTRTGRGLGTPHFMAPEQFRNAKNADVRCDIYSLGATLYQLVTGELPFRSSGPLDAWMKKINNEMIPPRKLVPSLPERVDWAIRRSMSADPEQRPATCREFVEDLTGHSTRKTSLPEGNAASQDIWYLVYKDEEGTTHTVKGTTGGIRRSLREGLLGDASNVRASRTKNPESFEALRNFPEFRDLVIAPAPLSPAAANSTPTTKLPSVASSLKVPSSSAAQSKARINAPSSGATVEHPDQAGAAADDGMPHIDLQPNVGTRVAWMQWVLMGVIALATFVAAYFLMPLIAP